MLITLRRIRQHLDRVTSDLRERIQRLEDEQAEFIARLESERALRIFMAQIGAAVEAAPVLGAAMERFAETMRMPLARGRAGGLARASRAWRYFDGTFMPESAKSEAFRHEYERYARGGRARALSAKRCSNGTFAPSHS